MISLWCRNQCGYERTAEIPRRIDHRTKDGSRVKVTRAIDENLYCTAFGTAKKEIIRKASQYSEDEVGVALWGVGNHGGVPSRKDLQDVKELITDSDCPIVHSTPEQYFADLKPKTEFAKSMQPCFIGCYTAMQSIKGKHIELENKLFTTEKLCSYASLNGLYNKNEAAFTEAEKALTPRVMICTQTSYVVLLIAPIPLMTVMQERCRLMSTVCTFFDKSNRE